MTPTDVANWMINELKTGRNLYQSRVAGHVFKSNPELIYRNKNGNKALQKSVLDAFRKLTPGDEIVWSRSSQMWRHRKPHDKPGRMQR